MAVSEAVPAVRTEGLTKRFGAVLALDGLDLTVERGEVFGFLGPNGAGKSTTIRLLLHLIRPTAGRAWLMGVPAGDVERAHRHVGYVPGDVALWPQLTGSEALRLLGNLSGGVDEGYRDELCRRFELDPARRIGTLSKGNRQKVALIAAFMHRPDVLLLDEPTDGLDPLKEAEFQQVVREAAERGQTVFLSSHLLAEVQDLCSRVAILRAGRLVEVSTLAGLRQRGITIFDVYFDGPLPSFAAVPGVVSEQPSDGGLRLSVSGSPAALLTALGRYPVRSVRSREPDLEEVFLGYYGVPDRR
ncbi:MAG TPA: ABC transporter ATP-binding protein [Jatrophihabitans sp.]|nr:ABC transporter ATP-binding protein [Jatrophihabitans sp.]